MTDTAAFGGAGGSAAGVGAWLRPRSAMEVLDGAFALYRATFARIVPRVLAFGLVPALIALEHPLVSSLLAGLLHPAWTALCLRDGLDEFAGRRTPPIRALGRAALDWVPLLLLYVLFVLALLVVAMIGGAPLFVAAVLAGVGGATAVAEAFTVLGMAVAFAAAAIPWAYFGLYSPVYLFERAGNPFSRSARLVRGGFWKVCGALVIANLIAALPTGVLQGVMWLEDGGSAGHPWAAGVAIKTWHALTAIGIGALVAPYGSLVALLLWIDRRAVREGLDLGPEGHAGAAG